MSIELHDHRLLLNFSKYPSKDYFEFSGGDEPLAFNVREEPPTR